MGLKRAILVQDLEATDKPLLADLSLHPRLLQTLADQRQILRPAVGGIWSGICELVLFTWLWGPYRQTRQEWLGVMLQHSLWVLISIVLETLHACAAKADTGPPISLPRPMPWP